MTKSKIISDDQIKVVREEKDLKENNKKLFLLDPSRAKFLKNKNINLFVNIASMQEMKHKSVKEYFDIIRNNKSFFYCCNRKSLTHFDGTTQEFFNYPWGNCSIIFSEICEWHKKYYDSNFPFIKKYEGTLFHRLVKYN